MLQQFLNQSSWRYYELTIEPGEVYTHTFDDTNPNQFVIVNPNKAVLHVGIHSMPTLERYEFKVEYNANETLGRPTGTRYIYIMNTSGVAATIQLFSLESTEFDMSILKNMNINLTDYVIQSNTQISGINAGVKIPVELPSVHIANVNAIATLLNNMLENDDENTLKIVSSFGTLSNLLNSINTETMENNGYLETLSNTTQGQSLAISNINNLLQKLVPQSIKYYKNNVTSFTYTPVTTEDFCFEYLFNDGDTATIKYDGTEILTLYKGEAIANLKISVQGGKPVTIESTNPLFRICYHSKIQY